MIRPEVKNSVYREEKKANCNFADRTSELRNKGFQGRNLGPFQMTTDTAVRVTRLVIQDKSVLSPYSMGYRNCLTNFAETLDMIEYYDQPEIHVNKNETISMPFRYVKDTNGQPIMPKVSRKIVFAFIANNSQGMIELIKNDSTKGFADLL